MATGVGLPTVLEIQQSRFHEIGTLNWLSDHEQTDTNIPDVISNLFSMLEGDGYSDRSLSILDYLMWLEKFLWPNWSTDARDDHTVLIAVAISVKKRDNSFNWGLLSKDEDKSSDFFGRVIALSLTSKNIRARTFLISFFDCAFQSLDSALVRRQVAPLVSISVWNSLHSDAIRDELIKSSGLQKSWRISKKRLDSADESKKPRLTLERTWLFSVVSEFLVLLYAESSDVNPEAIAYTERVLELLTDIVSQLPTRRFSNALLKDLNVSVAIKLSPVYKNERNLLIRQLHEILDHYLHFPIDDITGVVITGEALRAIKSKQVLRLQKIALDHFKDKLLVLALSNYGSVSKREDLLENLESLTDEELKQLCIYLDFATEYSFAGIPTGRQFLIELLADRFVKRPSLSDICEGLTSLPTEKALSSTVLQQASTYDSRKPLPIPRFNFQYLSVSDFLYRAFELHRLESFFEIKDDLEATVNRLRPQSTILELKLNGTSQMAQKISSPAILETASPLVGETHPAFVRAEVYLELDQVSSQVQKEWEALRSGDVVFLLAVQAPNARAANELERIGIKHVRAAEVVSILDHNSNPIHGVQSDDQQHKKRGRPLFGKLARRRRLHVNLDAVAYAQDPAKVYENINVIVRRRQRENNFKPILDTVKELTQDDVVLPDWLVDVFLGYGDPASASYENLPNRLESVDMNDTFINWSHLISSFEKKVVADSDDGLLPPYVLRETTRTVKAQAVEPPKKRGRGRAKKVQPPAEEAADIEEDVIMVSSYKTPNSGPYPVDARRRNSIPFTPAQVKAIYSGTNPGLTLVVGPPGTGKTDVATQIISNIYHANPEQRTLVIAHSNQALNRLFEKIIALDVNERHLLRLGHGEDELRTDSSFSRYGRVDSLLARREELLRDVTKLGNSVGAVGAHGESCEAAGYFYSIFVLPTWNKFLAARETVTDVSGISELFPFHSYFADAPQPLFNPEAHDLQQAIEIADGCFRHLEAIFTELEDIRPFELLRSAKDKANYLLTNEARIIALTSTHAAMKRSEIVSLGFRYENVIVEEAAELTEIESFIPLTLQSADNSALQRVILIGDHLQNAPVIQNLAFRKYANMEQSLFARLLRMNVPSVTLDAQGRARPEIAELYSWRYDVKLTNLPLCYESDEYKFANAGFKREFQFINVEDYNGQGETEPSAHFIQNLGEAEYAVAIFMYMRLLGYAADKITILATYAGQKVLIQNVLEERCARNPIFGVPVVATVDQYQGQQNDYVILSLVRTKRIGYLRDVRRLTVAVSRARLGLYVLGRRYVVESSFEVREFLDRLDANRGEGDKLELHVGEMFPSARLVGEIDESKVAVMEGVEHLGRFVYEMTNQKLDRMRAEGALPTLSEPVAQDHTEDESEDEEDYDEDFDEDEDEEGDDDEMDE